MTFTTTQQEHGGDLTMKWVGTLKDDEIGFSRPVDGQLTTLQASDMGYPIYERMGYRTIARWPHFTG